MLVAEGRDLEHVAAPAQRDGPERVLVHRTREQVKHPLRSRVRREIPVLRRPVEERVPHGPADDVPGMAVGVQVLDDREDVRRADGGEACRGTGRIRSAHPT